MNFMLKEGDLAPDFCLTNQEGKDVSLKDFKGQWVVLYFYPKDNTPGCTLEAKGFTKNIETFIEKDAVVIGISKDSVNSHVKFISKHKLKISLLSDPEHKIMDDPIEYSHRLWVIHLALMIQNYCHEIRFQTVLKIEFWPVFHHKYQVGAL